MAMSTRPLAASICGVKLVAMPPWRMNVPSWRLRTRSTLGLKVIVRVIVDTREALLIDTGTVYGPPATWNVVPGTVRMICPGVACGAPGAAAGVTSVSRGCVAGGAAPTGAPVVTGGMPGGMTPAGACVAGAGAAPGFSGTGAIGVGTGDVPGAGGRFTGCAPGSDATGARGTPPGATPGVVGITCVGPVPTDGTGASSGDGAMSGGGPPSPRFCWVPI